MNTLQKILESAKDLPESSQQEVLDFAEYLRQKLGNCKKAKEYQEWSDLSSEQAMRGMEDEPSEYSIDDTKGLN